MKVYVLTEIDLRHVGYSPNTVLLFPTYDEAVKEMDRMYKEALKKFNTNEDSDENAFSAAEGYAYVADADYRLDINECVMNSKFYSLTTLQELTVVAEEMGVREKLMTDRDLSRDEVWLLMQTWSDEFLDKYFKECEKAGRAACDVSYYDMIDEFVEKKYADLDKPEVELRADPMVIDYLYLYDKDKFGDVEEHPAKLQVYDGYAIGDGVRLEYPKLADLTREEEQRIIAEDLRDFFKGIATVNKKSRTIKFLPEEKIRATMQAEMSRVMGKLQERLESGDLTWNTLRCYGYDFRNDGTMFYWYGSCHSSGQFIENAPYLAGKTLYIGGILDYHC